MVLQKEQLKVKQTVRIKCEPQGTAFETAHESLSLMKWTGLVFSSDLDSCLQKCVQTSTHAQIPLPQNEKEIKQVLKYCILSS